MPSDTLERPMLGHNNPPAETPFERAAKAVEDIHAEVVLWLDGHAIDSQEMADGVANLLAEIRKAEKLADEARKAEKEPHDKAIKEIQDRYAPLIADTKAVKGKTVLAAEACKAALQPWLVAEDARIKEAGRLAREEAERQQREATAALRATDARNLAEREAAEALLREAHKAEAVAHRAEAQAATAGGTFGRAAGLRTVWTVTITDPADAARWVWQEARAEMLEFLMGWANRRVREGVRTIPGFSIVPDRKAV